MYLIVRINLITHQDTRIMADYKISKTMFNKEAIIKVAYLFQENYTISISEDADNYILTVEPKNSSCDFDFDLFNRQLQEQQLRETLNIQFGSLRDAIYTKAFEHFER